MTRCIILAAGQGSRLRPLTDNKPKALVPLLGKPLLERQISTLNAVGIEKIAIATGYQYDKIKQLGYPTYHNPDFATTNMVESLFAAREFFEHSNEDLVISYGDIVYQKNNIQTLLTAQGNLAVMVDSGWLSLWSARNENPLNDAETLKFNTHGDIIEIGKKPKTLDDINGQYTGLIRISREKIHELIKLYDTLDRSKSYDNKSFKQMYMTSFLQTLIDLGWHVRPAYVEHGWLEVDTVADLTLYEALSHSEELNKLWSPDK